jgi:3'-phosphoadenosine 5'-phosphosulfate sulfotransferase (PAPS reductase)/FAD synthetase
LKDAFHKFEKVGVAWSTGQDSTLTLFLSKKINPDVLVLFGDTTRHYQETYTFRDRLSKEWDLNLINVPTKVNNHKVKGNRSKCCHALKIESLHSKIHELHLNALVTGIRWDEDPRWANEDYTSEKMTAETYSFVEVHPILHWTENDVWNYMERNQVPNNPLYHKGFSSVDCENCPTPITRASVPINVKEQAKDREGIVERLRALGYW